MSQIWALYVAGNIELWSLGWRHHSARHQPGLLLGGLVT